MKNKINSKSVDEEKDSRNKKRIIGTVAGLKLYKSKKSNFFIRKLKLKSKSVGNSSAEVEECPIEVTERRPPEGAYNLTKSASETNLPNIAAAKNKLSSSTKSVNDLSQIEQDFERKLPERTISLENLRNMPAYGELILDAEQLTTNTNNQTTTSKPRDHLYKILVIGDLGTGKTSIIKRYVHRFFTQHYRATIGVDFALKVLNWDENTLIRLQLWDIAGQERYGNMTRVYYKEAVGAFIVFDVTRRSTFDSVKNWKADLDSKVQLPDGTAIPCVLLGNKCDQPKEGIVANPTKMDEYCKESGFSAWFETSARDNINIDEAARALVEKILEYDSILNNDKAGDQFTITPESTERSNSEKICSC